jgi:hypothetical protein
MIIAEDEKRDVALNLPAGTEQSKFSIAVNGKAFQLLVAGIYSDRIGSIVRELMSNADDAHRRVGNPAPFDVRVPNDLNPTFSIRDYGCSMTHEFVMQSYSTLFESSKSNSNDETGAFGLGAKAFLAYTDTCGITCWMDGEERVYMIMLDEDAIPTVTLISRTPSHAPTGVEVSFATDPTDFGAFRYAVEHSMLAYPTLPRVVGDLNGGKTVKVPEPYWTSEDGSLRLYSTNDLPTSYVVQGSALYPPYRSLWLPSALRSSFILTVPIGSVPVTASREALTYDADAEQHLLGMFNAQIEEYRITTLAAVVNADSLLKRLKLASEMQHLLNWYTPQQQAVLSLKVSLPTALGKVRYLLNGAEMKAVEGETYTEISSVTYNPNNRFEKYRIMVGDPYDPNNKFVRRRERLLAFFKDDTARVSGYNYPWDPSKNPVLWCPTQKEADLLAEYLSLPKRNVTHIFEIDDPRADQVRKTPVRRVFDVSRPWLVQNRNHYIFGQSAYNKKYRLAGMTLQQLAPEGFDAYTPAEADKLLKAGKILPQMNLYEVWKRRMDALTLTCVPYRVQQRTVEMLPFDVRPVLVPAMGLDLLSEPKDFSLWVSSFAYTAKITADIEFEAKRVYTQLSGRYPLLFNRSEQTIRDYIKSVDEELATATGSVVP